MERVTLCLSLGESITRSLCEYMYERCVCRRVKKCINDMMERRFCESIRFNVTFIGYEMQGHSDDMDGRSSSA